MATTKPRAKEIERSREIADQTSLPSRFAEVAMPDIFGMEFQMAPHIAAMEQIILPELLDFTKKSYISISAPPRHGKSMFVQILAAWFLMMFPTKRVIYVTYGDDLSQLAGRIVKKTIERFGPNLFDVHLAKTAPVADWQLANSPLSGMLSVGIGSGITGRGGDLIIIDDVIKNALEANSAATKALHVREYDSTIRTRLEPGGTMIMIATRWAEDDLPGTIRARAEDPDYEGDEWMFIDFPALAEIPEDEMDRLFDTMDPEAAELAMDDWRDMLGRKQGDALWPTRYDAEELRRTRASMDQLAWSALFQQRPSVRSGGMFPKNAWRYYGEAGDVPAEDILGNIVKKVWIWDTAFTKDGGDATAGMLLGMTRKRELAVLQFRSLRGDSAQVEKVIIDAARMTGPSTPIRLEQERSGSGKYVVQSFQRLLPGYDVDGVKPEGEKDERAGFLSAIVINGQFYLPAASERAALDDDMKPWIEAWVREFRAFPRGRHDDKVDAAVHGANLLLDSAEISVWSPHELGRLGGFDDIRHSLEEKGIYVFG